MQKAILVLIIFISALLTAAAQTTEENYSQAGELYSSGDFSGAAAIYRQLYEEGFRSEDLLYNAGNAFFKAGDNASAILFYERAKLIAPADEDTDYNLQIARSRITDNIITPMSYRIFKKKTWIYGHYHDRLYGNESYSNLLHHP